MALCAGLCGYALSRVSNVLASSLVVSSTSTVWHGTAPKLSCCPHGSQQSDGSVSCALPEQTYVRGWHQQPFDGYQQLGP